MANLTTIDAINDGSSGNSHNNEVDKVIVGDSFGNIIIFTLCLNDLSTNSTKPDLFDNQRRVLELNPIHNKLVKKKVFDEGCIKIKYIPQLKAFIGCSSSESVSLVIEDLEKFEKKDIKIKRQTGIAKGINSFCYCLKAQLIACASGDKTIRLYNPLILSKPCGKHETKIKNYSTIHFIYFLI
jgi:WD repeat-containing protein 64